MLSWECCLSLSFKFLMVQQISERGAYLEKILMEGVNLSCLVLFLFLFLLQKNKAKLWANLKQCQTFSNDTNFNYCHFFFLFSLSLSYIANTTPQQHKYCMYWHNLDSDTEDHLSVVLFSSFLCTERDNAVKCMMLMMVLNGWKRSQKHHFIPFWMCTYANTILMWRHNWRTTKFETRTKKKINDLTFLFIKTVILFVCFFCSSDEFFVSFQFDWVFH